MIFRILAATTFAITSVVGADPLPYAPVQTANPLKGFMPYDGDRGPYVAPHSMEFFYLPLKDLMNGPESFTWEPLDAKLNAIAGRGRQSVFRIYLDYPKKTPGTPDFLRNGPDGIPNTADDLVMNPYTEHGNDSQSLSPDYTNSHLRTALQNFIAALGARYDGDPRIAFIQMGLLGFWGEWHTFPHPWMPPLEGMQEVLGAYDNAFNQTRLLTREPKDASFQNYALGYHDDSFAYSTLAPPSWHFSGRLATRGETDRWKSEPIGGEIRPENQPGMWENPSTVPEGQGYDLCVAALHPSWMLAYGAFKTDLSPSARTLAEQQSRMLGYEFHVPSATIIAGTTDFPVNITARLRSTGAAPFYYPWPLELAVLNAANEIIHTSPTDWSLMDLLPGAPDRTMTHAIPSNTLPVGNHKLLLRAVNPLEGGMPLRFANVSQDADLPGWLTLGNLTLAPASSPPPAFKANEDLPSGSFNGESHPDDSNKIRAVNGEVHFIQNNTWVAYRNFGFAQGVTHFWIEAGSTKSDGAIEVWTRPPSSPLEDGPTVGQLVATLPITSTGGFNVFEKFSVTLPAGLSGTQDLYLRFTGGGGFLMDIRDFRFGTVAPGLKLRDSLLSSANFDSESHPSGAPIIIEDTGIGYIANDSWVSYSAFDFGPETNRLTIRGAAPGKGGRIEIRTDAVDGPLAGTIEIPHTGSWTHFRPFTATLTQTLSGIHDLYFRFVDSNSAGGYLFNIRDFTFAYEPSLDSIPYFADEDGDRIPKIIEYSTGMNTSSRDQVPLRMDVAAENAPGGSHDIEVRLRADDALETKLLVSRDLSEWDEVTVFHQNGTWHTDSIHVSIDAIIPHSEGLYTLRLNDSRTQDRLFTRLSATTREGGLHVYPPVPDLTASPYYTFSVQKVSQLNSPEKASATNWQHPFAWFTRCVDYPNGPGTTAYYSSFIGGWSHTYCNFELNSHTPIVIKITRLDKPGAPSGPITSAAAHPAHKVDSVEIINGEVYVTMSKPALVAIDIDGQLDSRDAPRAQPTGWGSDAFPYRNESNGAHGVTIFANPFIEDKPDPADPSVFTVAPGTMPPADGPWQTLYFLPGVHKWSVDENGEEREWQINDVLQPVNGKSYYIPGDAIIYGNINDWNDNLDSTGIRVFGHGTLSGEKIPHWQDFTGGSLPQEDHKKLRMLHLTWARDCRYEGLTVANPAEHGIYIEGPGGTYPQNHIKWVKSITWRVNNDGAGVTGNGIIEDCFFRHQDDALYIRGVAIRRCVLWSDVNGAPLRCSFITSDMGANFPSSLPQDLIVEDCDVIYARGVFGRPDSTAFGVIATPGAFGSTKTFADGTLNTAQHIIFRDIRVTDPRHVCQPASIRDGFYQQHDISLNQFNPLAK